MHLLEQREATEQLPTQHRRMMVEGVPHLATAEEALGQLRQTTQDLESSLEEEHEILQEFHRRAVELQER